MIWDALPDIRLDGIQDTGTAVPVPAKQANGLRSYDIQSNGSEFYVTLVMNADETHRVNTSFTYDISFQR